MRWLSVCSIAALLDRTCDGVGVGGTPCAAAIRCNARPPREQKWNFASSSAVNVARCPSYKQCGSDRAVPLIRMLLLPPLLLPLQVQGYRRQLAATGTCVRSDSSTVCNALTLSYWCLSVFPSICWRCFPLQELRLSNHLSFETFLPTKDGWILHRILSDALYPTHRCPRARHSRSEPRAVATSAPWHGLIPLAERGCGVTEMHLRRGSDILQQQRNS